MNTKIRFKHFHNGNDPEFAVRGPAIYATSASLVDLDTGNIIEEAWCFCSPNDVPSRKKGREIAKGRLERALNTGKWKERHPVPAYAQSIAERMRPSSLAELGV